ncbi:sensor histidine kinase [Dyadobacter aurulentus]|uniref:sensor histidine kinase n=1 Tax=Dyadobacter sp. UC 10 TaxID=2605428 RepID=UPI001788D207|nr:ATP-binding protein [Dyadobacter sp. UC 10]
MRTIWLNVNFFGLWVSLLFSISCLGQGNKPTDKDWKDIADQHRAGAIHDTVYLLKAQRLTESSFKDPLLKDRLADYKKVAWSNKDYQPFRIKYYAFLANHASALHQDGFAIYYVQKMEEELQKVKPYVNSLNQPRLLLYVYGTNDYTNHEKRLAIIDSITPFLKTLPALVSRQTVNINTCINAFTILKQSAALYASRKDTTKALEMQDLARKLLRVLRNKPNVDAGKIVHGQLLLYLIESDVAKLLSRKEEEGRILNAAYQATMSRDTVGNPIYKSAFESTILGRLIDYHIARKQIDSANYFFGLYKNKVQSSKGTATADGNRFRLYSGKINAVNGAYGAAYEDVLRASQITDSIVSIRTADIQNNMYANVIAEQRYEALIASQAQNGKRNVIIFAIIIALIATVAGFLWVLRANKKKAGRQIEKLNETTQIQIAELEAHANVIQKKLGLELHDDIAGRLASVVNYVETKILEEHDPGTRDKLAVIAGMTRSAYTSARSKSHEWYFKSSEEEKIAFSQRISYIVRLALPDDQYEKQIEIDDQCIEGMSPEMRIHLLRIIQEAVANILKHAKASKVKLFIYEDDGSAVLQISDNGKGFDQKLKLKAKGIGLESVKARTRELNGSLEIASSGSGTELLFHIPLRG